MTDNRPIGVFDSGVGGISILVRLTKEFPNETFIYFGDSVNAPFGEKTKEQLNKICDNAVQFFISKNCKAVVFACNTASVSSLEFLSEKYPEIKFVGTYPEIEFASKENPGTNVLLLATSFTVNSPIVKNLVNKASKVIKIDPVGCPGIIDFIEKGETSGENIERSLAKLLRDVKNTEYSAVIFGCTHYYFAREAIFKVLGKNYRFYDGSKSVVLSLKNILSDNTSSENGSVEMPEFYSSSKEDFAVSLMKKLYLDNLNN